MLQDERLNRDLIAFQNALEGWQRKIWTAFPAIVQAGENNGPVVASDGTIRCVNAIKGRTRNPAGQEQDVTWSMLIKVPLLCVGGGGFSVTSPIAAGDEVLVIVANRCIDGWWQSGGVQSQMELRMHNPSDGMAIPGLRSAPRALTGYSASTLQLRSDDGQCYVEVAGGHVVNIVAPGGLTVTAPFLHCTGAVTAGYGTGDSVGLQTHKHAQGNDTHGDSEVPTNAPTAGT